MKRRRNIVMFSSVLEISRFTQPYLFGFEILYKAFVNEGTIPSQGLQEQVTNKTMILGNSINLHGEEIRTILVRLQEIDLVKSQTLIYIQFGKENSHSGCHFQINMYLNFYYSYKNSVKERNIHAYIRKSFMTFLLTPRRVKCCNANKLIVNPFNVKL